MTENRFVTPGQVCFTRAIPRDEGTSHLCKFKANHPANSRVRAQHRSPGEIPASPVLGV